MKVEMVRCDFFGSVKMNELIGYTLCLIGAIYVFWRVATFLKTVLRLIKKSKYLNV